MFLSIRGQYSKSCDSTHVCYPSNTEQVYHPPVKFIKMTHEKFFAMRCYMVILIIKQLINSLWSDKSICTTKYRYRVHLPGISNVGTAMSEILLLRQQYLSSK